MRRFTQAAIVGMTLLALVFAPALTVPAHAQPGQTLAQGQPARECGAIELEQTYPTAQRTISRRCNWGFEYLYSKKDSKLILAGLENFVEFAGMAAKAYAPTRVAQGVLAIMAVGAPTAFDHAEQAIDDGYCIKIGFFAGVVVTPSLYRCV